MKEEIFSKNVENRVLVDFKLNGINVLEKQSQKQLESILLYANNGYYNKNALITDNEYDIIKEFIEKKFPKNNVVDNIGAPVLNNKIILPYEMWSMDKIKPDTKIIMNWLKKYTDSKVISCKLDGVSGMYLCNNNIRKLYTRGDGKIGQDISHLIPSLKLPTKENIVIRGEFIIEKKVFDAKYSTKFANARNLVSGIINKKTVDEKIKDVNFVAYEIISPIKKPSEQLNHLKSLDIETVQYRIDENISNDSLSTILKEWRSKNKYQIDGIIVVNDNIYPREHGNPKHAFAFKMVLSDQIAEAKVIDVIWTASKDGYLKPRVRIEPIHLGGVKIEYATGFNGSFIQKNMIGIGAIIEIIRSGDVIPYIKSVIIPAERAKMPNVSYIWNNTNVDVMLQNKEDDKNVNIKTIVRFFEKIEVTGMGEGNVTRIVNAGYDSIPKIIAMKIEDYLTIDGFQKTMASKLYLGVTTQLTKVRLSVIMNASNIFGRGFGEVKLDVLMDEYPDILQSTASNLNKIDDVSELKGFSRSSAELFVNKIDEFITFLQDCNLKNRLNMNVNKIKKKEIVNNSHPLYGKTIVMTGFRDKKIEDKIKEFGGKMGTSISKNTFLVLVKNRNDIGLKMKKALELNISIMTPDDFSKTYL